MSKAGPTAIKKPDRENISIHAEIQRDVERKITTGEWCPGFRIPKETDLLKEYNCSRMTVNKALSNLAAGGMIIRRRRAGSYVAPPRIVEPLLNIQDIRAEILASDRIYSFEITNRSIQRVTEPVDAHHIGVPVGTRMLVMDVMHLADRLPFTMETRQINIDTVPEVEHFEFDNEPPGSWLIHNVPWTDGEHSIRAISADAITAKRLQVAEHTACISIARRTWRNGDLITFARLIYPGDRHRFVVRFTPNAANPNH